ncbi:MAG: hypothetical protein EOO02_06745 [Chitinophagaceae bacterium]|nr:MAG: hypothetical protein EOO02_06745 [Chitinophagaceae bacterium]
MGKDRLLGSNANFTYPLTNKWNLNVSANLNYVMLEGVINGVLTKNSGTTGYANFNTSYKFENTWKDIAGKYNLQEPRLNSLASAWHTDLDLGRPIEVMADMSRSRKLGFTKFQSTQDSFFDLFRQLRTDRLIP